MSLVRPSFAPGVLLLLALVIPWPSSPVIAADRAALPSGVDGAEPRVLGPGSTEDQALRGSAEDWRKIRTRDAAWIVITERREDWDHAVAGPLEKALGPSGSAAALAAFFAAPPVGVRVLGPDLRGGAVRIPLPGERGDSTLILDLPLLLKDGGDAAATSRKRPNQGLFLSAAEVGPGDGGIRGLHIPGRPLPLVHGAPPPPSARPLPRGGKGDFVLFAGKGASGEEAEDLRRQLRRTLGGGPVPAATMRAFPEEGGIQGALRSFRVTGQRLRHEQDPWTTLCSDARDWNWDEARVRHPTAALAMVAPVTIETPDGVRQVIVGFAATYTQLFLELEEAALLSGNSARDLGRAIQAGELPVFRAEGSVWIHRGHLDRWVRGEARSRGEEGKSRSDASRQIEGWAEKAGSSAGARAARGPLPTRLEPIPAQELETVVGRGRGYRGRSQRDDLAEWVRHFDPALDKGGAPFVHALASRTQEFVRVEASFAVGLATVEADHTMADVDLDSTLPVATQPTSTVGPEARRITDLVVDPNGTCVPGSRIGAGVAFVVEGVAEGQKAMLRVEWDLLVAGRSVRRDALALSREGGAQDVELAVACPDKPGDTKLQVAVLWAEADTRADGSAVVAQGGRGGRTWKPLVMPDAKKCADVLPGEDEEGVSIDAGGGLTPSDLAAAVRAFQEETLRCHPAGRPASGTVVLEITVGCDGRVSGVTVASDESGNPTFSACVADTFRYAPFPAHSNPGGVVFQQPLHYE